MNALKRGCAELSLVWAVAGYALYSFFHPRFEPPGDLWGAVIGGLLVSWSWGAVRNLFGTLSRRSLLAEADTGFGPQDGKPYAATGTTVALGEPLRSPFRKKECVAYGYSVYSRKIVRYRRSGKSSDEIEKKFYMGGYAMCPFALRTSNGDVPVLGFAIPDAFPEDCATAPSLEPQILAYIAETTFEEEQGLGIRQKWSELKNVLTESDGSHRYDWKSANLERVLGEATTYATEQCLPAGAQVCVIGQYSAEKGGLISDYNVGGMEILPGGIADAMRALRSRIIGYVVTALLLAVLGTLGAYGLLSLRESRSTEIVGLHRERFKAGIREDDVAKVASAIQRGISPGSGGSDIDDVVPLIRSEAMLDLLVRNGFDVNRRMKNGYTPLIYAVERHDRRLARWLIDAGADVNARQEGWGTTALEKALDSGDQELVQMLAAKHGVALFVTAENGSPVAPHDGQEMAVINEYLRAFSGEDAAALREVTDNWPADFFASFARGLYRGATSYPATFVRGFRNDTAATILVTCSNSGRLEVRACTLVNRDGKWKVRRDALQ
jgi:hypothetical protein